jgi:hypothetical protein
MQTLLRQKRQKEKLNKETPLLLLQTLMWQTLELRTSLVYMIILLSFLVN